MYCIKCGKQIEDDSRFCIHCGAIQEAPEPEPVFMTSPEPVFTPEAAPAETLFADDQADAVAEEIGQDVAQIVKNEPVFSDWSQPQAEPVAPAFDSIPVPAAAEDDEDTVIPEEDETEITEDDETDLTPDDPFDDRTCDLYLIRSETGERVFVSKGFFTVGRASSKNPADYGIATDDHKISRRQFIIFFANDSYLLADISARNETSLNEENLGGNAADITDPAQFTCTYPLKDGDIIRVRKETFTVKMEIRG